MKKFTIVGQYWDNQQTWIDTVEATTADMAASQVPDGIFPLAVFEGDLTPAASFDESDYV